METEEQGARAAEQPAELRRLAVEAAGKAAPTVTGGAPRSAVDEINCYSRAAAMKDAEILRGRGLSSGWAPPALASPALKAITKTKQEAGEEKHRKLDSLWPLTCIAYTVIASSLSPALAYIFLLLYTAPLLLSEETRTINMKKSDALVVGFAVITGHLPAAWFASGYNPSAPALMFTVTSSIVEEMFFRGILLPREGLLMQAFVFALTHLTLSDPVSLVLSALLWPHYLLLGLTFGIIAQRRSWYLSAVAHAAYNVVAIIYSLPLELRVVYVLLVADALALLFVTLYFHVLR